MGAKEWEAGQGAWEVDIWEYISQGGGQVPDLSLSSVRHLQLLHLLGERMWSVGLRLHLRDHEHKKM